MFTRLMPCVACVALLAACAGGGQGAGSAPREQPTVAGAMAEADAAALAGQEDKAYAILKGAGSAFPAEKAPWLRMAQMRFEADNYGEAIVNALEALRRDPDDTLANSIVAVSGLRVSSKALADLSHKNNLTGSVRGEAADLAKLLRTSLGEDVLVPQPRGARKETGKRAPPAPQARPAPGSDPFGALK